MKTPSELTNQIRNDRHLYQLKCIGKYMLIGLLVIGSYVAGLKTPRKPVIKEVRIEKVITNNIVSRVNVYQTSEQYRIIRQLQTEITMLRNQPPVIIQSPKVVQSQNVEQPQKSLHINGRGIGAWK
jgi:hypothetical protein